MNIISKKSKIQSHESKSAAAFGAFRAAVTNLTNINRDIDVEEKIIETAEENKGLMILIRDKNQKMANKISDFFELD